MVAPYSVALYGSRRVRLAAGIGAGVALVAVALPTGLPSSERSGVLGLLLSVVVVQAQAAQRTLDRDVDRARAVVASIEGTGREALDEMRQLLWVLRAGAELERDGEGGPFGPQPGLERLGELVEQVRAVGLPVTLRVEGARRRLAATVDLSAFRIVQEALTNALKHAGPAHAEVVVRYGDRELELTVSDDGRGAAARLEGGRGGLPGSGHGLVGMRERVALFDGELIAGPQPGGVRVLILTTFNLDEYVVEALRAGASGFLLKDVPAAELVSAIRVVAAGDAVVAPAVTRRLLDRFAHRLPGAEEATRPAPLPLEALTERELGVLRLVARGLSNAEIAAELVVTETTVKTHVHHLLTKLGMRDRVQLVVLAYEAGLVRPQAS